MPAPNQETLSVPTQVGEPSNITTSGLVLRAKCATRPTAGVGGGEAGHTVWPSRVAQSWRYDE